MSMTCSCFSALFRAFLRRLRQKNMAIAARMDRTPMMPTTMPATAPLERPPPPSGVP